MAASKLAILDAAELSYDTNYGKYMKTAGTAGSRYVSYAEAVQEIIVGARDIADEVGNQKIGNPVGSGLESDPDYIESPYALNSITDFIDNLRSVRSAYAGPANHTLSAYVRGIDATLTPASSRPSTTTRPRRALPSRRCPTSQSGTIPAAGSVRPMSPPRPLSSSRHRLLSRRP